MSRSALPVLSLLAGGLSLAAAQTPVTVPPPVPATATPAPKVAPPMPGELNAAPAPTPPPVTPAPSRIPDLPVPETTRVPSVPLGKSGPPSSTSTSGQFIVHGGELPLRSAFSSRCEEVAAELNTLLKDPRGWGLPVVVLLTTGEEAKKAAKAVEMTVSQITGGGFHLQLNVNVRPDLRPADLRAELVRILLVERILRGKQEITSNRKLVLPDWLFNGIMEALDFRRRARPSALFAAIFKSGRIFGIEEIIEAPADTVNDALSKSIYQTSCCALVLALLDQPDGGANLGRFLNALASDPQPERDLLNKHFPGFSISPASLNKWWSLQMASLSSPGMSEPLSAYDTLVRLEEALTLRYEVKASEAPQPRPMFASLIKAATPPPPSAEPTQLGLRPQEVASTTSAAARPRSTSTTTRKVSETPPDLQVPEEGLEPEKKRSFFGWMNPFGGRGGDDEIEAAIKEAERAEAAERRAVRAQVEDAPPAALEDKKPKPLFARWFGKDPEPEKPKPAVEEAPPAPKPADSEKVDASGRGVAPVKPPTAAKSKAATPKATPKKTPSAEEPSAKPKEEKEAPPPAEKPMEKPAEKPAAEAKPEPKPEEPKKEEPAMEEPKKPSGGFFNRLFRGKKDKKTEDSGGESEEKPKKEEGEAGGESAATRTLQNMLWSWSPALGDLYAATPSLWSPTPRSRQVEGFLGLKFGKKKTLPAEEPKKEEPAKEEPKKPTKEDSAKKAPAKEAPAKEAEKPAKADEKPAKPAAEEAPKPAPAKEESPAAPEPAMEEAPKPKKEPRRLRLFGGSKKETPEEPAPEMPAETKEAPPAPTPAAEEKPKMEEAPPEPEAEKPRPSKPTPAPKKAASKKAPPAPEPLVAAATSVENYALVIKRPDREEIFKHNINALASLQNRASVLFRPIIMDYSTLLIDLRDGKTKDVDARLRALRTRCQKALEQTKAVRLLLDVHEANELTHMSGLFEDYLKLPETLERELPPRNDAISRYLDALDQEFSRD